MMHDGPGGWIPGFAHWGVGLVFWILVVLVLVLVVQSLRGK